MNVLSPSNFAISLTVGPLRECSSFNSVVIDWGIFKIVLAFPLSCTTSSSFLVFGFLETANIKAVINSIASARIMYSRCSGLFQSIPKNSFCSLSSTRVWKTVSGKTGEIGEISLTIPSSVSSIGCSWILLTILVLSNNIVGLGAVGFLTSCSKARLLRGNTFLLTETISPRNSSALAINDAASSTKSTSSSLYEVSTSTLIFSLVS